MEKFQDHIIEKSQKKFVTLENVGANVERNIQAIKASVKGV
jgi:site-specific DNA-cytosine methylase